MNIPVKILAFMFFLWLSFPLMSADGIVKGGKTHVIRLGTEETISSEGIKLKVFKDAVAKPMPPINTRKIRNNRGENFEVYNPAELWLCDQYVGSWGEEQNMISIFKMSLPPPNKVSSVFQGLVFKNHYEKWKAEVKPDWNETLVAEWIRYIANGKLKDAKGEPVLKDISKKNRIVRYYSGDAVEDAYRQIYTAECSDRPNERYVIIYEFGRSTDIKKSDRTVLQSLESLSFFTPKKSDDRDKQMTTLKSIKKKDYSDEYVQSKEKVIQSIRNLKGWWYLETENFIIVSDLKNRKTINELQINLEKSRNVYMKFYPLQVPLKAVSVCKVFETREEYLSYVPSEMSRTTGMWMASKKELVISPVSRGTLSDNRRAMVDLVFHEAFHQYIYYAANEIYAASWFNEGNACFFMGIDFKAGDKVKIELTNRANHMKKIAGGIDIKNFIHLSHPQFYADKTGETYTLAWGLMFFLQKGAPVLRDKNNYSEIPNKYYEALIELKNGDRATDKAWEGVDFKKFNSEFNDFWKSNTQIRRAEMYDPLEAREKNATKDKPSG